MKFIATVLTRYYVKSIIFEAPNWAEAYNSFLEINHDKAMLVSISLFME